MKSNSLALESLVVARDRAVLTPPISLTLEAGDMLAIHGGNGSGKSTLLKTIAGFIPPYKSAQGSAAGDPLPPGEVEKRSSRFSGEGASPLPQPILYNGTWPITPRPLYFGHLRGLTPSMSVYDNVAFWAKAAGYPELTQAAMRYFDLDDIPAATVSELSAGWQQRVALTRLITIPSSLWLLDEPTANLDAEGIALLQSLMQSRLEQGGIILVATHMQLQGNKIKTLNLNAIDGTIKVAA